MEHSNLLKRLQYRGVDQEDVEINPDRHYPIQTQSKSGTLIILGGGLIQVSTYQRPLHLVLPKTLILSVFLDFSQKP